MQDYKKGEGWQALSNISSFMQHADKRKQLKIFGELDARLDYCEYLIRIQTNKNDTERFKAKKRKKELNEDLINALKSLATTEIIQYYNKLIDQLINLTYNICDPPLIQNKTFIICEAYSKTYNLKIWKKKKLRFDRENHIIYAEKDKKIKIYDLANYLIRRSENSDYFVLALEAINDTPLEKSRTAHFGFQYKNTFILWFTSIQRSIEYKQWESLVIALNKEHLLHKNKSIYHSTHKEKEETRLNRTQGYQIDHDQYPHQFVQSAILIPQRSAEQLSSTIQPIKRQANEAKTQNVQTSQFQVQKQEQVQKIIQQSHIYKLTHNPNAYANLQDLQFQLQVESQELKKKKAQISFARSLFDEVQINNQSLQNFSDFEEIEAMNQVNKINGQAYIYKNRNCNNHFRMVYLSPIDHTDKRLKIQILVEHFLNLDQYRKISKNIVNNSLKSVIYSENSTISFQQHFPYNRLYRPREFFYVRHLTSNDENQIFIIDRSIVGSHLLNQNKFDVRGQLSNIYRFSLDNSHVMVMADIKMNHKGGITEKQNECLSQKYLQNLSQGLSQYFLQEKFVKTKTKYYNFESHKKHFTSSIDRTEGHQALTLSYSIQSIKKESFIEKKKTIKKRKQSSFYQIQRTNLIQSNTMSESYLIDQGSEELSEMMPLRKTYSPPRKTYLQIFSPKGSIVQVDQKQDWKIIVQPIWKDQWKIDEEKGGFIQKRSASTKEKELLKRVIETAAKKTLLGKDIQKISFPVDVLAPESKLQRLLKNFLYVPNIFKQCSISGTFQLFKKTVVFGILSSLLSLYNEKPFDAILGQTYQCQISSDCFGYAEQTGVSPGTSAVYIEGNGFQVSAFLRQKFKLTMNSASWENEGISKIVFNDGTEICYTTPPATLSGLTFNQRSFYLEGKSYFWITNSNWMLVLDFEPKNTFARNQTGKIDYFQGVIHEVTPAFMNSFAFKKAKPTEAQIVKVLSKVTGRWTKYISFEDETIEFQHIQICQMFAIDNPLPSDSSFREDINHLRNQNLEQAEKAKLMLEERQRKDECLRHQLY